MKLTELTNEEKEYIDNIDDPITVTEIYPCFPPPIRLGIRLNDDALVGTIILFNINGKCRKAEIGIHIFDPRGTLIGYKVLKRFIAEAFKNLPLNRIYARIHSDNERCLRCAKYIGFQQEGTERQSLFVCDKFKDIVVMSILKDDIQKEGIING